MVNVLRRRQLLASTASIASLFGLGASADSIVGYPYQPDHNTLPVGAPPSGWTFFNADEVAAIGALVDRLIPSDDLSPGGRQAGIDVYIDRQLSGNFGNDVGMYIQPPFADGLPGMGPQSPLTPAQRYRKSLAALDDFTKSANLGKAFVDLAAADQDKLIAQMQSGELQLQGVSSKAFFLLLWQNTKEGFFADPIYGGNKNMVGWKLIGFPGARYDYRDWIDKPNQPYPKAPIGMADHPDWSNPS